MNRLLLGLVLLGFITSAHAAPQKPAAKKPAAKPAAKPKPKPAAKPAPKTTQAPNPGQPPVVPPNPGLPADPPAPEPPPVAAGPKTWALLVGVSKYQNPAISGLRYPAKDAAGLRDALVDPSLGGLPATQVKLLADDDATQDNINSAVQTFLKPNVKEGDQVIVFLAGHGVAKGVGLDAKSYLLPTDVKGLTSAALESSAVNMRSLADNLATLPAAQFVVFVDACREDPTPGRGVKGNAMSDILSRGIQVMPQNEEAESATFFACSVGQRAFEDPAYGHGVFTNWILEGIRQGSVPQKPDGAVDMGRLSSYVKRRVAEWAKQTSAKGDFEVEQTPELVSSPLQKPLVLLKVKRPLADTTVTPTPPRLLVAASPAAAQVSINGQHAGSGTVEKDLPAEGEINVTITAPGYAPVARSVKGISGYEQQLVVQLTPEAGGGATTANDPAADMYKRAVDAQAREQWEVAEQGYNAALGANPKYLAAYEGLLELHRLQNRNLDAIGDAQGLVANSPRGAHPLSLLSRAYVRFAEKGAGSDNARDSLPTVSGYGKPRDANDAVKLAQKAAIEAVSIDANSAEASLAQGYALAALDTKGKNKRAAMAAFGKAAFQDPQDAANQLGMGYGLRYYAVQQKKEDDRDSDVRRAINSLNEAIKIRPDYYEAHRELGYCYTILNDTDKALKEFEVANANRGGASDSDEVAGNDVALAGLHKKAAENSTGDEKAGHEAASEGYMADAKENAKDMKVAMTLLNAAGVSTSLQSYLPAEVSKWLDPKSAIEGEIRNRIPGLGGLGGIFGR